MDFSKSFFDELNLFSYALVFRLKTLCIYLNTHAIKDSCHFKMRMIYKPNVRNRMLSMNLYDILRGKSFLIK